MFSGSACLNGQANCQTCDQPWSGSSVQSLVPLRRASWRVGGCRHDGTRCSHSERPSWPGPGVGGHVKS